MKSTALAGYQMLLGCPEVSRRVGQGASEGQRQKAAHAALKDAIADLPTKRDQLIGQAILAATHEFQGKNVDERKRALDKGHGIDENAFKRRRPVLLKLIVAFLLDNGLEESAPLELSTLDGYRQALSDLLCVVDDVIRLYEQCRAYLFICTYNRTLVGSNDWTPGCDRILRDALYRSYVDLVISGGYCFDAQAYSRAKEIKTNLPGEASTLLSSALENIYRVLPLDADRRITVCTAFFTGLPNPRDGRFFWDRLDRRFTEWILGLRFGLEDDLIDIPGIVEVCAGFLKIAEHSLGLVGNQSNGRLGYPHAMQILTGHFNVIADDPNFYAGRTLEQQFIHQCFLGKLIEANAD